MEILQKQNERVDEYVENIAKFRNANHSSF